jgi:GntR family transcriptional regulator, arabinose operon transcriptional repressor
MPDIEKPKYQKLKEYIIDTIKSRELKPGDQIHSENELSDRFGISRHTVRQSIGELTSEGWLYRVHGKGTFVDRRPDEKSSSARTIGVVTTYLGDYIFPSIIRGIDSVLSVEGYNIVLGCTYNQHEKERICLENLKGQNLAGLIVEPTKSALPNPNLDLYRELSESGIPVLFIHGCYKDLNYSYIVEDDVQAGYLATKHLIELGHTRIGGIFKIDDVQGHYRFSGFQKAHMEAGLKLSDARILWFDTGEVEEKLKKDGTNRLSQLLEDCSGIVCYNDQIAVEIMDAIRSQGLSVPEDVSLVSFDDSQLAVASETKLTTIAHPKERLGEEAATAMIQMIERKQNYFDVKMRPELVVRGSTRTRDEGRRTKDEDED